MSAKRILVVDDETNIRRILQVALEKAGYVPSVAENAEKALQLLSEEDFLCVLTDVTMPGRNGYELLREIKQRWDSVPVVIMTAYGTIPQAVQAVRDGAFEFVTKPFDLETVKKIVAAACQAKREVPGKSKKKTDDGAAPFLALSPPMLEVVELVKQVADTKATVMIGGESGVGKEVVARALHRLSSRANRPFVAVSCAAIPESLLEAELFGHEKGAFTGAMTAKAGRFETADTGTLLLDEVGEIPGQVQVKLLRVLQEREFERLGASKPTKVDVRVISATHRNLHEAVEAGIFRMDLLYRLQVIEINIPPLRERKEDILPLARLFLEKQAAENGRSVLEIPDSVGRILLDYRWPGNVRELENTMERALVLASASCSELEARLLPPTVRRAA